MRTVTYLLCSDKLARRRERTGNPGFPPTRDDQSRLTSAESSPHKGRPVGSFAATDSHRKTANGLLRQPGWLNLGPSRRHLMSAALRSPAARDQRKGG